VGEGFGGKPGEGGGALAQGKQAGRNRLRRADAGVVEIVSPTEVDGPALAGEAVELEILERELVELGNQTLLVSGADQVGHVAEARRERGLRVNKLG
jgi:hypothetical protein